MMAAARRRGGMKGFFKDFIDLGTAVLLFIHYFIEKMSVWWFGPSLDWFIQRGYTPHCMLDTLDRVCETTDNPDIILSPHPPSNHQLCSILK